MARWPLLPPGRFYSKIPSTQDAVDAHPTRYVKSKLYGITCIFFRVPRSAARRRRSSQAAVIKTLEALVVRVRDEAQEVVFDRPYCCYLGRVAHDT